MWKYLSLSLVILLNVDLTGAQCGVTFRLASYFANNMVLQKPPVRPRIWGFAANVGDLVTVSSNTAGQTVSTNAVMAPSGNIIWEAVLQPIPRGPTAHSFNIQQGTCMITLTNVLIGDVWVCSGQSNMQFQMNELDNPQPDLEDVVNYPDVRTFFASLVTSSFPVDDLLAVQRNWALPTPANMAQFSSLCWLFGRNLYRRFEYPIGLIETNWGGTRIEAWASPPALDRCPPLSPGTGPNAASALYNSMIHPFLRFPIYGAIWYQGESNTGNFQQYPCYLKSMVQDWRERWHSFSPEMDNQFPFGVVQLAPWRNQDIIPGFPDIRWAQTDGFGYLPNVNMAKFFKAVAIDLPDYASPSGDIHPRYKRPIADRLELAAAAVAYGMNVGDYQGPLPNAYSLAAGNTIRVTYNVLTEKRSDSPYFEFCCGATPTQYCTAGGRWVSASRSSQDVNPDIHVLFNNPCGSTESVTGYRYIWRESPCALLNCPLYSVQHPLPGVGLPAAPFLYHGPFTQE